MTRHQIRLQRYYRLAKFKMNLLRVEHPIVQKGITIYSRCYFFNKYRVLEVILGFFIICTFMLNDAAISVRSAAEKK